MPRLHVYDRNEPRGERARVSATVPEMHVDVGYWERLFKDDAVKKDLLTAAVAPSGQRSFWIPFNEIDRRNPGLAQRVLDEPDKQFCHAQDAIETVDIPLDPKPKLRLRIHALPESSTLDVGRLRGEHLGRLVAVRGIIRSASPVRDRVSNALFKCLRCGAYIRQEQRDLLTLQLPVECYEDQGGCSRDSNFELVTTPVKGINTRFEDFQRVEIQEYPENLREGVQPDRITAFLREDLCSKLRPGLRVRLNGVVAGLLVKKKGALQTVLERVVHAASFDLEQVDYEEITITPEDEAEFKAAAEEIDHYQTLVESIAPSIFGYSREKESLLLQVFGGTPDKITEDGRELRSQIHIAFVGDPGVAKTQLGRSMMKVTPRGVFVSGTSSSGVGITAAAVADPFNEGSYMVEAGALVQANKGLAVIDEADKMKDEDRAKMHDALDPGIINVHKGNAHMELQSKCACLLIANPRDGHFDPNSSLAEQIDLPSTLLSRFDLIFTFVDKPDRNRDTLIARHSLDAHRTAALRARGRVDTQTATEFTPHRSSDWIRRFIAYAKRTAFPALSEAAQQRLHDFYVTLRSKAAVNEEAPLPLTARNLDALVRLSEARAKIHLRDEVTLEDAEYTIGLVEEMLGRLSGNKGVLDVNAHELGKTKAQTDREKTILREIEKATPEHDGGLGASRPTLLKTLTETYKYPPGLVDRILTTLQKRDELRLTTDFVKLTDVGRRRL